MHLQRREVGADPLHRRLLTTRKVPATYPFTALTEPNCLFNWYFSLLKGSCTSDMLHCFFELCLSEDILSLCDA